MNTSVGSICARLAWYANWIATTTAVAAQKPARGVHSRAARSRTSAIVPSAASSDGSRKLQRKLPSSARADASSQK